MLQILVTQKARKLLLVSISIVAMAGSVSCGKKKSSIKKPNSTSLSGADAQSGSNFQCQQNAANCPRVRLALSGISALGGQADSLMIWDVGGVAPDDRQRQVVVVMDTTLPGMETISSATDARVSVNWKPIAAQQGTLKFRARDMTRCQRMSGGSGNCHDMNIFLDQFDQILETPFQVMEKGIDFNAGQSDFFRQFHCKKANDGSDAAKAIYAGASIATGAAAGAISDNGTARNGAAQGAKKASGSTRESIAVITDYLVNGESKPTPYECLAQNASASKNGPATQTTTVPVQ